MDAKDSRPTPRTDALLPTTYQEIVEHSRHLERSNAELGMMLAKIVRSLDFGELDRDDPMVRDAVTALRNAGIET